MFSKFGVWYSRLLLSIIAGCCVLSLANVSADSNAPMLVVKPDRCIGLHQGQTCYANLAFRWQTPVTGEYCLFDDRMPEPLICWAGNERSAYNYEFAADKNVVYDIRTRLDQQSISQALVKISWVYKSNTKSSSRWRLF